MNQFEAPKFFDLGKNYSDLLGCFETVIQGHFRIFIIEKWKYLLRF